MFPTDVLESTIKVDSLNTEMFMEIRLTNNERKIKRGQESVSN